MALRLYVTRLNLFPCQLGRKRLFNQLFHRRSNGWMATNHLRLGLLEERKTGDDEGHVERAGKLG